MISKTMTGQQWGFDPNIWGYNRILAGVGQGGAVKIEQGHLEVGGNWIIHKQIN